MIEERWYYSTYASSTTKTALKKVLGSKVHNLKGVPKNDIEPWMIAIT